MALPRRPPSAERYETARRLMAAVRGADLASIDVCLTVWRLSDELTASFEAFYASHGLSSARGHVLAQLYDAPHGRTPAELAERAGTTPPTMTGLLRSLERKGLIRRQRVARDRRSQCILLTSAGKACVRGLLPIFARRLHRLGGALPGSQRAAFVSGCRRIAERAHELSEETEPRARPHRRRAPHARRAGSRRAAPS
jgi:DNA-binding MarR family transcriptional regulator